MIKLTSTQQKVLDIYHNDGTQKAWNYWKLMGNTYGIFLGEVPSNEFIDGESLAKHIGLTEGVLCNVDTNWLKFILDGNIMYIPMKPLMHSVSWDAIKDCGAVFENEGASVDIDGIDYDITIPNGLYIDEKTDTSGYDFQESYNSEWNRCFYVISHRLLHDKRFESWASYSDADLVMSDVYGNGSFTWSKIPNIKNRQTRLFRGGDGVAYIFRYTNFIVESSRGWRPILRFCLNH